MAATEIEGLASTSLAQAPGVEASGLDVRDEAEQARVSRRGLLKGLAGALGKGARRASFLGEQRVIAAAAGLAAGGLASRGVRAGVASADVDPGALLTKLGNRITYFPTDVELGLAYTLGYEGYLEYHLNYTAIADPDVAPKLAPLTTVAMSPSDLFLDDGTRPLTGTIRDELTDAAMIRAVYSKRQLYERMVEFWSDHFSIDINDGDSRYLKTVDDREVIRPHALGMFPDMLRASAQSPSMLSYLDNASSVVGNPNENYARELLELHTLGVNGGYTQNDVREVARCFTGWTYWNSAVSNGVNAGTFRYRSDRHDTAQKVVLGQVIPARPATSGMQDGLDVLNILASHPSTANFLATKLCNWLLGETVHTSVVASVAQAYLATGGDIKAMVRAALRPQNLFDAPPKFKRPFHLVISALRALPTTITSWTALRGQVTAGGHRTFTWPAPNGYPDTLGYWSGLLLPRWSFGASLMNGTTGSILGAVVDDVAFFGGNSTADQLVTKVSSALFRGELPSAEYLRLRDFVSSNPLSRTVRREMIGVAVAAPSFQWY